MLSSFAQNLVLHGLMSQHGPQDTEEFSKAVENEIIDLRKFTAAEWVIILLTGIATGTLLWIIGLPILLALEKQADTDLRTNVAKLYEEGSVGFHEQLGYKRRQDYQGTIPGDQEIEVSLNISGHQLKATQKYEGGETSVWMQFDDQVPVVKSGYSFQEFSYELMVMRAKAEAARLFPIYPEDSVEEIKIKSDLSEIYCLYADFYCCKGGCDLWGASSRNFYCIEYLKAHPSSRDALLKIFLENGTGSFENAENKILDPYSTRCLDLSYAAYQRGDKESGQLYTSASIAMTTFFEALKFSDETIEAFEEISL